MTTASYEQILQMTRQLKVSDQLRLLGALADEVRQRVQTPGQRSIMELEGLGAEIWEGIDAQAYVDQERDSWER